MEEKTPFGKEANLTGEQGTLVLRCPVFCVRNGPLYLRETKLSRRSKEKALRYRIFWDGGASPSYLRASARVGGR